MEHIILGLVFLIALRTAILFRRKAIEYKDNYIYIDKPYFFWCLVYEVISVITFTRIIRKLFF
jgi:hypothetical protein